VGGFARIMRRSGHHASFDLAAGAAKIINHRKIKGSQTNQLLVLDMDPTTSNSNGATLWPMSSFS
jgi:hypothetical protein